MNPYMNAPCSSTPAGLQVPGHSWHWNAAAAYYEGVGSREFQFFRGSITRLIHALSTLREMGLPIAAQDSLPAVGRTLPDGTGYPLGFNVKGFSLHDILLPQASPGAP